nr:PA14 domain-containing protein [Fimbriimonadaceae bacterium]
YNRFFVPIDWTIRFWNFDLAKEDPREGTNFAAVTQRTAAHQFRTRDLSLAGMGFARSGVNNVGFATVGEGTFRVRPGKYRLNVTSDDGVRVFIDGKKVIENWTYHGPTLDTAELQLTGDHSIRLEHFQLDGYATIKVEVARL